MNRTLYIQMDNNSLPEGCGEVVEGLDCRCINDFCSIVGDALVSDLKDEDGKPFYRLINPVGRLLMDFKAVDEKSFNAIVEEWYDILGILLHKGIQGDDIEIKFPQQYVDWLLHSDDPYYEQVGKELQKANGKITLPTEAIDEDIIASLNYKVSHKLQEKKDDFSFAVFSNPIIRNSSFVVKRVRLEGIEFMRYDSWMENIMTAPQKTINVNGISFEMIRVEGGTFMMGASEQDTTASSNEKPCHLVTLNTFYIGKYKVTQELWQAVMGNNPSCFKGRDRPVECVNWIDCQDFIQKLNKLSGMHFRLPTEAEWEYAARGGNMSKGNKYAGSNDINAVAWYQSNSDNKTHPVGEKLPNELGIFDFFGNVFEWCQDYYSAYNSNSQTNPKGPNSGSLRVDRGIGYCNFEGSVSSRSGCEPSSRIVNRGLRLAL